jgi:hypothetical protein
MNLLERQSKKSDHRERRVHRDLFFSALLAISAVKLIRGFSPFYDQIANR